MKVLFDIDGSLCHCHPRFKNFAKKVARMSMPWLFIYLGLLLTNQKIDKEMIQILNAFSFRCTIWVNSARPKQTEKYTIKYLKNNGAVFFKEVECLGVGSDIVKRKVDNAVQKRINIVIDDDDEVLKEVAKKGIVGCAPEVFKRLYKSGAIR